MMDEMTVLRLPFMMPWIWKHCLVVALRSCCPYLSHRSSTRRYSSGVTSPAGDLRTSKRTGESEQDIRSAAENKSDPDPFVIYRYEISKLLT